CEKELEKYPVHAHKNKGDHILAGSKKQSHHVVQNAQFMKNGKAVATICENYKYGDAPCIPLKGPSTDRTTPHGRATKMQEADALASKASGVPITYGDAKKNSRKQLLHAGLTPEEVECVMMVVDAMIRAMCEDITDSTILRTPGGD
ncbi:hypothetical protein PO883_32105, partial [Massilia sp. DJPM01]|uniref:hypothetical protein n=1 Tax=Massilia sp. DJPM01 TaxID=3024404 RepID=UPI00259E347E